MTDKIAFEVSNPTSKIEKFWDKKIKTRFIFFWTPCMFLTHVYNDNKRISSDPFTLQFYSKSRKQTMRRGNWYSWHIVWCPEQIIQFSLIFEVGFPSSNAIFSVMKSWSFCALWKALFMWIWKMVLLFMLGHIWKKL